ncbi:glycoside hydrolase family 2 TIM barrel-domain containing protein [Granulicella rosea]|uniref:glycoside hydrolase family 2 TIM barrel-domain containing protein n=1 Tax=Granulicella rosea TaxID=474952 RepID=UPI001FE452B1|nr:glycoside hydrolase family 2 TIM barrel-domain containing protein [Granulicella rosea]
MPTSLPFLSLPLRKRFPVSSFVAGLLFACALSATAQNSARQVRSLDAQWKFLAEDAKKAEAPDFNDSGWKTVDAPHDWSIAGPVDKANTTGQGGGYFPNGVGWYRKDIALTEADAHKHVYVVFDGVMANSDVWINGAHLGKRPNGTVSFFYELTGHLQFGAGAHNILAVRCDNAQQPASRWYEGAGIYRHVRLVVTGDLHIEPWSTVVTTPKISPASATVHVETTIVNDSDKPATKVQVSFALAGPAGKIPGDWGAPRDIPAKGMVTIGRDIPVANPAIWDLDHPAMYTATASVRTGAAAADTDEVPFGIREFHFDAATGFWLNGKNFKLKGAAMHIEAGGVGIAVPAGVYEHRLLALKALGVNAIRTAHNPPSPDFLDLCDKLGLLVMDEMFDQWTVGKNPFDYHLFFQQWALRDTRDTVRRDRNHPSIILWSAGNEIHDTPQAALANKILTSLVQVFHENDPSRPVTQGLFRPNASHDYDNGLADLLDVVGQNYREQEILAAHAQKPTRKILGTENTHDRNQWIALRDNPPYSGQFLWTGIDYLGEAGEAGGWPLIGNGSGLLDRTGYPRARAFERESWWGTTPNVHIARRVAPTERTSVDPGYETAPARFKQSLFLDWTPEKPGDHVETVEGYTNCEEAELFLNGKSLGRQKLHPDATPLSWKVPYAPGSLKVVGYVGGKGVATDELLTAGKATKLHLTAEHAKTTADDSGVIYIYAEVADDAGTMVPDATNLIHFAVTGPGAIVAVDSGSNADHDSFQKPDRHAYEGRAVAILRATGPGAITVTASSPGLATATTTVQAAAPAPPAFVRSF